MSPDESVPTALLTDQGITRPSWSSAHTLGKPRSTVTHAKNSQAITWDALRKNAERIQRRTITQRQVQSLGMIAMPGARRGLARETSCSRGSVHRLVQRRAKTDSIEIGLRGRPYRGATRRLAGELRDACRP